MSEQTIFRQIREFQIEMEGVEILKTTEAYGYYYATLQDIEKIIKPVLRKHGIWYNHSTGYEITLGQNYLRTIFYLIDKEEESVSIRTLIDKEAKVGGMNRFMIEGAAITYFKRYHITTILGLTTDEDTDAGGKRVVKKDNKPTGRSIEAQSNSGPNFIEVFKGLLESKSKDQINKTFAAYKPQMNNDQIKEVQKLINEKHGN